MAKGRHGSEDEKAIFIIGLVKEEIIILVQEIIHIKEIIHRHIPDIISSETLWRVLDIFAAENYRIWIHKAGLLLEAMIP